jgi:hypothetical protein
MSANRAVSPRDLSGGLAGLAKDWNLVVRTDSLVEQSGFEPAVRFQVESARTASSPIPERLPNSSATARPILITNCERCVEKPPLRWLASKRLNGIKSVQPDERDPKRDQEEEPRDSRTVRDIREALVSSPKSASGATRPRRSATKSNIASRNCRWRMCSARTRLPNRAAF